MSLAVRLDSHNRVVQCIEIPDDQDDNVSNFINFTLNIRGTWISVSGCYTNPGQNVSIGHTYLPDKNKFVIEQPFDDWILDENDYWIPPVKNNLRNMSYGYENEISDGPSFFWNQERKMWGHSGIEDHILNQNNRDSGIYFISKAIRVTDQEYASDFVKELNVQCNGRAYKYVDVHPDWDEDFIYPVFRETFAAKYGVLNSNPDRFHCYENYIMPFDGAPYFFVHYSNLCDLNKKRNLQDKHEVVKDHLYEVSVEFEKELICQHPYIAGRTLSELFKLIMDWDICYHLFNNRENTAILCHDIMSTIDMPKDICDEIYKNTPPSIIEKYLMGDQKCLDIGDRPSENESVMEWFAEKYWSLRYLKHHEHSNIKEVNKNHHIPVT
jgi:hypothetical protein